MTYFLFFEVLWVFFLSPLLWQFLVFFFIYWAIYTLWGISVWWLSIFSSGNFSSIISLTIFSVKILSSLFFWNYYYFNTRTPELILYLIFSFLFSILCVFLLYFPGNILKCICSNFCAIFNFCFPRVDFDFDFQEFLFVLWMFLFYNLLLFCGCNLTFFWWITNFIEFSLKKIGLFILFYWGIIDE